MPRKNFNAAVRGRTGVVQAPTYEPAMFVSLLERLRAEWRERKNG